MLQVTEKMIYRQLSGSYVSYLTAELIAGGIIGFCAIFCGTQLSWLNLLTIIALAALLVCLVLIGITAFRLARMKRHPVFERYGAAPMLAAFINDGLQHPRYLSRTSKPFGTLITDQFIVSGVEMFSYMELKDIQWIQPSYMPKVHVISASDPLTLAGSVVMNRAADHYVDSHGGTNDFLTLEDAAGMKRMYGIPRGDMERVLAILREAAPHIRGIG